MSARTCDDCDTGMEKGERRQRCKRCWLLVCGWCMHHIHDHPANQAAGSRHDLADMGEG